MSKTRDVSAADAALVVATAIVISLLISPGHSNNKRLYRPSKLPSQSQTNRQRV